MTSVFQNFWKNSSMLVVSSITDVLRPTCCLTHVPPKAAAGSHNPKGLKAFVTLLLRIQAGIKIILLKLLCHTEYEQKQDFVICSSKLSPCLGPKINSFFTDVFYVWNKNFKY